MKKHKLNLKWFGSHSNLSMHRSSEKPRPQPAPVHRGSDPTPVHHGTEAEDDKSHPLSPCYARSSDMYTHVGTVPRSGSKRASFRRGSKHGKKNEKQEMRSMSSVENVMDSPLLGALQTLPAAPPQVTSSPSLLTSSPSPLTPSPLTPSPLTSGVVELQVKGVISDAGSVSNDVYVFMEPITLSEKDLTDANGEYVQFSKEKPCLDPCNKQIQEDRLKFESVACYHGNISAEVCKALLVTPGDFLFHDSPTIRGDLLLSCRCGRDLLHFQVRSEGHGLFSVSGRSFPSLVDLMHFYVNNRASLSQHTEAYIQRPVDRAFPLSHRSIDSEYTYPDSPSAHHRETEMSRGPQVTVRSSDLPSDCSAPQSVSPDCSRLNVSPSPTERSDANKPLTLTRPTSLSFSQKQDLKQDLDRESNQDLDQNLEQEDSSGYTELYPPSYVDRLGIEANSLEQLKTKNVSFCPVIETTSCFSAASYQSALMPRENKPLEVKILQRVKVILAEIDPKMVAKHITKADCVVGRVVQVSPELQRRMGVASGIELLTLPHGQQLRLDLLERFETMAIMLAVHVLGCTGTSEERAALINKLILVASELKDSLGNMFGFATVMRALQLPQVSRLEQTWATLRQRHTEGAVLFEKTLRPFMKSLNEGRESCSLSSTSFPHVLPLLWLMERGAPGPGEALGEVPEMWNSEMGVDVLMFHLSAARTIAQLGNVYRNNASAKLNGLEEDAEVDEVFDTEFQLRLLWGNRGASEKQSLRYEKFNQVLTALSTRLEPPGRTR